MSEIIEMKSNKKYIKLSSSVLRNILNAKVLSKRASTTWLHIYSSSYHYYNHKIAVYRQDLADDMHVSLRTISRALHELVLKGFLSIVPYHPDDLYSINTYECTLPEWLKKQVEIDDEFWIENISRMNHANNQEKHNQQKQCATITHEEVPKPEKKSAGQICQDEGKERLFSSGKSDPHKYINNIYINTQCKDCEVSTDLIQKEPEIEGEIERFEGDSVEELEKKLKDYEGWLDKAAKDFAESPTIDNFNNKRRLEDIFYGIKNDIAKIASEKQRLDKERQTKMETAKFHEGLSDENYVNSIDGGRKISSGLFWWLKKKMFSMGVSKEKLPFVLNEIIYAVRFGALKVMKFSFEEMPLMRAINIALKLVREDRWQTPVNFSSKLATG